MLNFHFEQNLQSESACILEGLTPPLEFSIEMHVHTTLLAGSKLSEGIRGLSVIL